MSNFKHDLLAAASPDAIEGKIEVERWKFIWHRSTHGYWGRSGADYLWTRPSSSRALLAKEREFYMKVTTSEHEGVTTWQCKYETDQHGSYCRHVFKTRHPREFYEMDVAARSERMIIGAFAGQARPSKTVCL